MPKSQRLQKNLTEQGFKTEEQFEVIDEKGKVLDLKPRSEVHGLGLKHRAADLLILDERDRIFIQQRAQNKDLMPLKWDFSVAEHLQPNESYRDAARRGAEEELNVKVRNLKLLGEIDFYFEGLSGEIGH